MSIASKFAEEALKAAGRAQDIVEEARNRIKESNENAARVKEDAKVKAEQLAEEAQAAREVADKAILEFEQITKQVEAATLAGNRDADDLTAEALKSAADKDAAIAEADEREREAKKATEEAQAIAEDVASKITIFVTVLSLSEEAEEETDRARHAAEQADISLGQSPGSDDLRSVSEAKDAETRAEEALKEIIKMREDKRREADAAIAAELILPIRLFFEEHKEQIYERLEECDSVARRATSNADILFIAESLPIINGIIHVGATRSSLNKAIKWVRSYWGEAADSLIVLSALIFMYVVDRGADEYATSSDRKKNRLWKQIKDRVRKQL